MPIESLRIVRNDLSWDVLFRCDGGASQGLGHVSRCLGLAEAAEELGLRCGFCGRFEENAIAMLRAAGFPWTSMRVDSGSATDLDWMRKRFRGGQVKCIVVDSYLVDESYIAVLERDVARVFLIDDFARFPTYPCSVLLNFTVGAADVAYPSTEARKLFGIRYFLARRNLRKLRLRLVPAHSRVEKVLIAIGGVDRHGLTLRVLRILAGLARDVTVSVVVGKGFGATGSLQTLIRRFPVGSRIRVQVPDLSVEFEGADLCICGGGLTKYEAAYLGIPTGVISQTFQQAADTVHFAGRHLAWNLGTYEQDDDLVSTGIRQLLEDFQLRNVLRRAGLTGFPDDPTWNSAMVLASQVTEERRSWQGELE